MSAREQLLKMQRIILRQLKDSVNQIEGHLPREVQKYHRAYRRELQRFTRVSNKPHLIKRVIESDIVFGADFHAYAQSQRTHLRILREVASTSKRPIVIALEAIGSNYQDSIERYLAGRISEKKFLESIQYEKNWGFPWAQYKVFFDFAMEHKFKIYGLNTKLNRSFDNLQKRDSFGAREIAKIRSQNPDALIYVIYGDLHLAKPHLPGMTKKALAHDRAIKMLTIFQNSENLYFKLAQQKLENRVEVVQLHENAFCVVNSPPWTKWQAYLNFLEMDEGGVDHDVLCQYISMIEKLWQTKGRPRSDFEVFQRGDPKIFSYLNPRMSPQDMKWVLGLTKKSRSFFVPAPPTFYIAAAEPHHLAGLAGQYVHSRLRRDRRLFRQYPKEFLNQVWIEAVGYFASLMFNPHRKPRTLGRYDRPNHVALILLEYRLREKLALTSGRPMKPMKKHPGARPTDYADAARLAGAGLGIKIYQSYRRSKISAAQWLELLRQPSWKQFDMSRFLSEVYLKTKELKNHEPKMSERL